MPEGFVAVAKNTLRVISLERLGEFFNQQTLRLRYTPRKFVIHPGACVRRGSCCRKLPQTAAAKHRGALACSDGKTLQGVMQVPAAQLLTGA